MNNKLSNETNYLSTLYDVLNHGKIRSDRTGVGTLSLFGKSMVFDLQNGFPLLTTKKMFWRGIVEEFLFFLRGGSNIKELQEKDIHFWDSWANNDGYMGDGTYGKVWRKWPGKHDTVIDQIDQLMIGLKNDPMSRRHLIVGYNPGLIWNTVLPTCHSNIIQFYVDGDELSLQAYLRSNDLLLGSPFNIAMYGLMLQLFSHQLGYKPKNIHYVIGDAHIYQNHLVQVREQLSREVLPPPTLFINKHKENVWDYLFEDFELRGYNHHSAIKAKVAV